MLALLTDVGGDVDWTGPNDVHVHVAEVRNTELDRELCSQMRASFLLAGPLLVRAGSAIVPPPGGDVIGRRRLDPHIHGFTSLGAHVDAGDVYDMRADGLRSADVFLDEASVMATENIVMAASLTHGKTVIGNAACEPHVQDLCRFLGSLGAQIEGIESNVLRIEGVESLRGGEWTIGPDHVEIASFIGLAAVTGGDVTVEGVRTEDLVSILPTFGRLGVRVEVGEGRVRVPPEQELYIEDDIGGHIPKIEDGPWPAFPSDLTSIALTVATQARGTVLLFEKMFENRWARGSSSATRTAPSSPARRSSAGSEWRARTSVPACRCCSRASAPRASRRSAPCTRSTRATSGSTNACARSVLTSSEFPVSGR
jgi:UDP-N-acetylglucosamine 1-carboxyvinyltransferase